MDEELLALERLVEIAKGNTGQSRTVANFLLAWWNAGDFGGFDLTDLWAVDRAIADDMIQVMHLIARQREYPDNYGPSYWCDFKEIIRRWRSELK